MSLFSAIWEEAILTKQMGKYYDQRVGYNEYDSRNTH